MNSREDSVLINLFWQRQLHQHAVNILVCHHGIHRALHLLVMGHRQIGPPPAHVRVRHAVLAAQRLEQGPGARAVGVHVGPIEEQRVRLRTEAFGDTCTDARGVSRMER